MSAGDLFQLFGGAGAGVVGVCLIIVILFIRGDISTKKQFDQADQRADQRYEAIREERDEWKKAYELERARGDANVVTGSIVRDVMLGLRKELD